MAMLRRLFGSWLPVLVAFVLGASMVGVSWATVTFTETVKARDFRYSSPKAARLVIGAAAFVPTSGSCTFLYENGHHFHDLGSGCVYSAQVELPQRAVVTKVQWFLANGPNSVLTLNAWSPGLIPSGTALSTITSTCVGTCELADTSITTSAGANPVNNALSHYSLDIDTDLSGTITVNKVIVTYTTNRVGPASA